MSVWLEHDEINFELKADADFLDSLEMCARFASELTANGPMWKWTTFAAGTALKSILALAMERKEPWSIYSEQSKDDLRKATTLQDDLRGRLNKGESLSPEDTTFAQCGSLLPPLQVRDGSSLVFYAIKEMKLVPFKGGGLTKLIALLRDTEELSEPENFGRPVRDLALHIVMAMRTVEYLLQDHAWDSDTVGEHRRRCLELTDQVIVAVLPYYHRSSNTTRQFGTSKDAAWLGGAPEMHPH